MMSFLGGSVTKAGWEANSPDRGQSLPPKESPEGVCLRGMSMKLLSWSQIQSGLDCLVALCRFSVVHCIAWHRVAHIRSKHASIDENSGQARGM